MATVAHRARMAFARTIVDSRRLAAKLSACVELPCCNASVLTTPDERVLVTTPVTNQTDNFQTASPCICGGRLFSQNVRRASGCGVARNCFLRHIILDFGVGLRLIAGKAQPGVMISVSKSGGLKNRSRNTGP